MDASKLIDHFCPVVPSVSPAAIAALPSVNCLLGGTCSHLLPAGPGGQNTLVVGWPSAGCRQETGPQISIYLLYSLSRDLCSVERAPAVGAKATPPIIGFVITGTNIHCLLVLSKNYCSHHRTNAGSEYWCQ